MVFSVSDLFVVGLAVDCVGAYVVARGLLDEAAALMVQSMTFLGSSGAVAVASAEDRFGLGALLVGFVDQAVAYLLSPALSTTSLGRAAVAVGLAALAGAAALLRWRAAREARVDRTLVDLAPCEVPMSGVTFGDALFADRLAAYGRHRQNARREGESSEAYCARVFGTASTLPRCWTDHVEGPEPASP